MIRVKFSFPFKISFTYLVLGILWILFSDKLLSYLVFDIETMAVIQLYKGWFFILVTAILFYIFVRKELVRRNDLINKLQVANKKATESDELKTAFLGNLSHYIRTPMNSILGFVELLEQRNLDNDKRLRFYNLINQQSKHLLQFINNIVEVSKIQSGQLTISEKYFHINAVVKKLQINILLDISERQKNINLLIDTALPDDKDVLLSDESKIKHVLYNLVSNAINATEKGEITIGYYSEKSNIVFFVRDTGCGVPEYVMQYIFKGFVFSTPTELKQSEGFGLGLYLSAGMVKLMGGNLWLRYTGPDGSEFCFTIPYVQ